MADGVASFHISAEKRLPINRDVRDVEKARLEYHPSEMLCFFMNRFIFLGSNGLFLTRKPVSLPSSTFRFCPFRTMAIISSNFTFFSNAHRDIRVLYCLSLKPVLDIDIPNEVQY